MKKIYETPSVEKIKFNYRDQVVAASGDQENVTGSNGSQMILVTCGSGTDEFLEGAIDFRVCDWSQIA